MSQVDRGKHRRPRSGVRHLIDSYRRPEPAQAGDGNDWQTGFCWFWCAWDMEQLVVHVGGIEAPGRLRAHMTACAQCVEILFDKTWSHVTDRDSRNNAVGRRRESA